MPRTLRSLTSALVVAAALALPVAPAAASCLFDDRPLGAQVADHDGPVFVGTVVELGDAQRSARFRVEEIWKGDVPATVVVHGGPDDPGMATSIDRSWLPGETYLVTAFVEGDRLTDNACSPTRLLDAEVEAARPADARPVAQEDDGGDTVGDATGSGPSPALALGGAALLAVIGLAGVYVWGRRTPRPDRP